MWCALIALLAPAIAHAHPAPFSYVDLSLSRDRVDASVTIHIIDLGHDLELDTLLVLDPATLEGRRADVVRLVVDRLQIAADQGPPLAAEWAGSDPLDARAAVRVRLRYPLKRPASMLRVAGAALFPYDSHHQTFINVYENGRLRQQAIFDRSPRQIDYFAGTRQGTLAVVRKFVPAGVHHILIGPDHILFLVGLLLLGGSVRRLLVIITAFTVAHSVTLSIAALGLLSPPARVIEPAIALSIVYIGADNLLVTGLKPRATRYGRDLRAWIALGFGLVHGFGFAGVLREMGLPPTALAWSLFSFNLGVEIGQVLIVAAAASLLALVRARSARAAQLVVTAGSTVVIVAGSWWFIQRVL